MTDFLSDADVGLAPSSGGSAPPPKSGPLSDADVGLVSNQPTISTAEALSRGIANSLPGAAHLGALADTASSYLPKFVQSAVSTNQADQSGEGFGQRYSENLAAERGADAAAMAQHPIISTAVPLAGAIATLPVAGPEEAASAALGKILPAAATKIAAPAAVSAGYGAAYGAGNANTWADVPKEAGVGAALGAGAGAAGTGIGIGFQKGLGAAADALGLAPKWKFWNGAPEIATDKIAQTMGEGTPALTPAEYAQAQATGLNPMVADLGTESTRGLAKVASNASGEARGILGDAVTPRYEAQSNQVESFLENKYGPLDNAQIKADQIAQAKTDNTPLYRQAYADGAGGVWSRDLSNLAQSPYVQRNLSTAVDMANDYVAKNGGARVSNPFRRGPSGTTVLGTDAAGNPMVPSLMFWDQVKRSMDGQIGKLMASGQKALAAPIIDTKNKLLDALDSAVPSFAAARSSAYNAFQAQNALEAGQKYASMSANNMKLGDAAAAVAKMSAPEKALFARGFAGQLSTMANAPGVSRNIPGMLSSPLTRQKAEVAMGPQAANELEAHLGLMSSIDRLRTALGNSKTQQNAEGAAHHGLFGAAAGAAGPAVTGALTTGAAAYHFSGGDPWETAKYATLGALGGVLKGRMTSTRQAVQKQIAEQLTSGDPTKINAAIARAAKDPGTMNWLRSGIGYLSGNAAPILAPPTAPGP